MLQELFRIPGLNLPIYGFGVMLVIAFFAATQLARRLARRRGLNGELFINAGLLALLAGVIGCRASHILENWQEFTRPELGLWGNLWNAFNISSGGLTYYGGFFLAFPTLVFYALWKKVPIRLGMDIVAPCLMLGLAFGRIGCFLNGCCYGAETSGPWAVQFPYYSNAYLDEYAHGKLQMPPPPELLGRDRFGRPVLLPPQALRSDPALQALAAQQHSNAVHPAELYSSVTAFLLTAVLLAYLASPHLPGHVFALMLILEPIARFILEMLRVEPPLTWLGGLGLNWSLSMALAVPQVILGIALWIAFRRFANRSPAPALAPSAR